MKSLIELIHRLNYQSEADSIKTNFETVQKILELAQRYPSGDNCQPFRLEKVSDSTFLIFHDDAIAAHTLNINNIASKISLGCYLSYLELSALKHEIRLNFELFDLSHSAKAWARIDFADCQSTQEIENNIHPFDRLLSENLTIRHTERRPFKMKSEIPADFNEFLDFEMKRSSFRFKWSLHSKLSKETLQYFGNVEKYFWLNSNAAYETFQWVRLGESEKLRSRDGMPGETLGVPPPALVALYFLRSSKVLLKLVAHLGLALNQKLIQIGLLKSSSMVGALYIPKTTDDKTWVHVGQHYVRMWIWLCANGWGFQPVTIGTMLFGLQKMGILPNSLDKLGTFISNNAQNFELQFKPAEHPDWIPIWGFRAGPTNRLKKISQGLRRTLPF